MNRMAIKNFEKTINITESPIKKKLIESLLNKTAGRLSENEKKSFLLLDKNLQQRFVYTAMTEGDTKKSFE